MTLNGLRRSHAGRRALIAFPLVALCAVACAATLCYTDSTPENTAVIKAVQNGNGNAGAFTINSTNPMCPNGAVVGVARVSSGLGGYFTLKTNPPSSNDQGAAVEGINEAGGSNSFAMYSYTQGLGGCAFYNINANMSPIPPNPNPALQANTYGTGNAANFTIRNPSSNTDTLVASTNGTGYAANFGNNIYVKSLS